jgi:clathrin heavy chain
MAKNFFKQNPATNVHSIAELFATANRFQELTAFLVDCMKGNRPEDGPWQTRVLEFNLQFAPQVAETILQMDQWNQYNRPKIA